MRKHRSERAIKCWLITRIWYKKYKYNLHQEHGNYEKEMEFLNGLYGELTISGAFCYRDTPEGVEYWGKKEEKFLRWYYYQGKEIFRCGRFSIQI